MSKVGIFGGTFDPIHLGHLITALCVLEKRNLDKIIFIPCFISPHKINSEGISAKHRLKLVKLSIKRFSQFDYSDYEIKKRDISYTVNTIKHFKKKYEEIDLIIGFDNLVVFDKWFKPDEIVKLANLVVLNRNQNNFTENRFFNSAIFIDTPTIDISSTEIRNRIKNNLQIDFLVEDKVKNYILKNNLYKI